MANDIKRFSKIFYIWMNEGIAPDGERVIPVEWIDELRDASKGPYYAGYEEIGIRYHNQMTTDGTFLAHAGWGGQFMNTDTENDVSYVMFSALTDANGGVQEDKNAMYRVGLTISEYFSK